MAPVARSLVKKILSKYFQLSYPGSFQSIPKYKRALKDVDNINISHATLRKILKSNLNYTAHIIRKKKFFRRKTYARGVGLECLTDVAYVQYDIFKKKRTKHAGRDTIIFPFLLIIDALSRFVITHWIDKVNPENLRKAFLYLFSHGGLIRYPIMRYDLDPSIKFLETKEIFFSS